MGEKELEHLGGLAVVEGVMVRTPQQTGVAVRKPEGDIVVKKFDFDSLKKKPILGWPFIRGVVELFEMLYTGMKVLSWSASQAFEEEEELSKGEIVVTIGFSLALALVLFKLLPLAVANFFPGGSTNNFIFNLIDGLAKIAILVGYIWAISFMDDVKRIFQYHGAEHKTIMAYEKGLKLTKKNIKKQPKENARCGTSFILLVLILSIMFYMLIPLSHGFWAKYGLRILLLPVIAGTSYEIIKLASKHPDNKLFKVITYPGIMLQWITTSEPEDDMIEVAVRAVEEVTS